MSRFKEARRIEQAIKHKNTEELAWALEYCKSRVAFAKLKVHQKRWKKQITEIEAILGSIEK